MKHYTIEEKQFITKYRPIVEIESIEFCCFKVKSDELDEMDLSFVSDAAAQKRLKSESRKDCDIIWATFRFRDRGADFAQKYVRFHKTAGIYGAKGSSVFDVGSYQPYTAIADKEGRFSVSIPVGTVPLWTETDTGDDADHFADLCREKANFVFSGITIGNEFVCEVFDMIKGTFGKNGTAEFVHIGGIAHELTPEPKEV